MAGRAPRPGRRHRPGRRTPRRRGSPNSDAERDPCGISAPREIALRNGSWRPAEMTVARCVTDARVCVREEGRTGQSPDRRRCSPLQLGSLTDRRRLSGEPRAGVRSRSLRSHEPAQRPQKSSKIGLCSVRNVCVQLTWRACEIPGRINEIALVRMRSIDVAVQSVSDVCDSGLMHVFYQGKTISRIICITPKVFL